MPEYNKDFESLKKRADCGEQEALEQIFENNVGLVRSIVKRFSGRGTEPEDLFQIGSMGLVKAIKKFDLSYNVKFSTYAVPMIMGEIKRFLRDDGIIKVSRSLKELSMKAASVKENLTRELGYEPTVKEIAERVGVSPEELSCAIEAAAKPESIYSVGDNGSNESMALIDKLEAPEDIEKNITDKLLIDKMLSEYPEREQKILKLRYYMGKTQSEIAEKLGISQVQVSRIEKRLLYDMRRKILS